MLAVHETETLLLFDLEPAIELANINLPKPLEVVLVADTLAIAVFVAKLVM